MALLQCWKDSIRLAEMFDSGAVQLAGKTVLELGAGAGLPGLIADALISQLCSKVTRTLLRAELMCTCACFRNSVLISHGSVCTDILAHVCVPCTMLLHCIAQYCHASISLQHCSYHNSTLKVQMPTCIYIVLTDYGTAADQSLIEAIQLNIASLSEHVQSNSMIAAPYVWGNTVEPLLQLLADSEAPNSNAELKFDYILLADLLFNRSEHRKLLQSCKAALAQTGSVYVTWGHHDPHKTELDLKFFELATSEEFNFKLQHLAPVQYTDLFQENDGLDDARGLVYTC
eukprot:6824-Heterococcus_DN1.PRE.8